MVIQVRPSGEKYETNGFGGTYYAAPPLPQTPTPTDSSHFAATGNLLMIITPSVLEIDII